MRLVPSLLATALVLLQITAFAKHTKINSPAPARVFFEPNAGQADKAVRWLGRSGDSSLLLLDDGAVFLPQSGAQVRLKFDGAGQVTATGEEPQPGVSNYYPRQRRRAMAERYSPLCAGYTLPGRIRGLT